MPSRETTVPPMATGVGRTLDIAMIHGNADTIAADVGAATFWDKGVVRGGAAAATAVFTGLIGGTATINNFFHRGRLCARFAGNGDAHRAFRVVIPLMIQQPIGPAVPLDIDGARVYRVMALLAHDDSGPIPATPATTGLWLMNEPSNANVTVESASPALNVDTRGIGITLGVGGANNWTFQAKTSIAAADVYSFGAGLNVVDTREWNLFEFRLFSATEATQASVQVIVNGSVQVTQTFDGVNLPQYGGSSFSLMPKILRTGFAGGNTALCVAGLRVVAGNAIHLGM